MEYAFLLFGMAIGIVIGMQYHRFQVVKKKNPKVIAAVRKWLEESER